MSQPKFIGIWIKWYAARTGRRTEEIKIGGRHGKSAKEMIQHFKRAYPDRTPEECLEAILNNWDRLDNWFKNKPEFMELWAINDHLNNIITKIKNGSSDHNRKQAEIDRAINDIQRG